VLMNIELVAAAEFAKSEARNYLSYGIIFGILIAMAFYGFFLFVSLKYRSYLYFILYTVSVGLWLFYVQGFAKVLFGQMPGFDQAMLWFWAGMFITWGTIFTISFLELQKTSRFLFYILAAAVRLKQGFRSALYYLIAWSFLVLGGFVFSLMGLKVLPVHFLTVNATSIGVAIEFILLSMAFADRFKQVETERKFLESKQEQYRELSITDTLTGLYNKRYLQAELGHAIEKALQLATISSFRLHIPCAAALGKATQHAALVETSLSFSCPAFQRSRHSVLQSESASISKPRACA